MKRTFLVKKDPTIEAQDNWLIMDYRQYVAWRETDEGKNREIVFGKFEACSEDDSIIFMECNEKVSKELKKDCHGKRCGFSKRYFLVLVACRHLTCTKTECRKMFLSLIAPLTTIRLNRGKRSNRLPYIFAQGQER